jgi:hypothetical protein
VRHDGSGHTFPTIRRGTLSGLEPFLSHGSHVLLKDVIIHEMCQKKRAVALELFESRTLSAVWAVIFRIIVSRVCLGIAILGMHKESVGVI